MLRLFIKFINLAVVIGVKNTKARSFINRNVNNRNCTSGVLALVKIEHFVVVHFVDMVSRKDHNILGVISLDCLIGAKAVYAGMHSVKIPRLTVAYVFVEDQRLILGQNSHSLNTGIYTVGQRKVNNTIFSAKGHGRLGKLFCKHAQARALSARKQHSHYFLFLTIQTTVARKCRHQKITFLGNVCFLNNNLQM